MTSTMRSPRAILHFLTLSLVVAFGLVLERSATPPAGAAAGASTAQAASPIRALTVPNGTFRHGTRNWHRVGSRRISFTSARGGYVGRSARLYTPRAVRRMVLEQRPESAARAQEGADYRAAAMVKVTRTTNVFLRVREFNGSRSRIQLTRMRIRPGRWRRIVVSTTARYARSSFQLSISAYRPSRRTVLRADNVTLTRQTVPGVRALSPPSTCGASDRGLPECGAYFGATVGPQETVARFEQGAGGRLAVRRSFYQAHEVSRAIRVAENDIARGRVPWISFKLPHSWAEMANGDGDAWARNIASRLADLDGPVWVAFHHEPENDGHIRQWTRTQERLAPIVRRRAPNVAYSVIVTAYHQTDGNTARYGLSTIWPNTTVDLLGIDSYNYYGVPGRPNANHADLVREHYEPIGAWARARGIPWGVAEIGYTARALSIDRHWLRDSYLGMQANGGIAMAYFNSNPDSSVGDWTLGSAARMDAYADVLPGSARWPSTG